MSSICNCNNTFYQFIENHQYHTLPSNSTQNSNLYQIPGNDLFALSEEKNSMALFLPQLQQRFNDYHFSRSLEVTIPTFIFVSVKIRFKLTWATGRNIWMVTDFSQSDQSWKHLREYEKNMFL